MKKNKEHLVSAICSLIAAILLGTMTYEHFYSGDIVRGVIYLIGTICNIIVIIIEAKKYK